MSYFRSHKQDANASQLKHFWEGMGGVAEILDREVDQIWGAFGFVVLIEVKNPQYKTKLTEREQKFKNKWQHRGNYEIVETIDDVIALWGKLKQMRYILTKENQGA